MVLNLIKRWLGSGDTEPRILVLGDLHAEVFSSPEAGTLFPGHELRVVTVAGATASGSANPNSQAQAHPIFCGVLKKSRAGVAVVMLGEADVGLVIWNKSKAQHLPVRDLLRKAVNAYCAFLEKANARMPVVCISAPLPTIPDNRHWGEEANARKHITASMRSRTQLTLEFNRQVGAYCRSRHIRHVNLDEVSIGANGIVRPELINADPNKFYYNRDEYLTIIRDHVVPVVNQVLKQ